MTGKVLRATILSASLLLMTLGMTLLTQPSTDHMNHILGAGMIISGVLCAFIREQIKEEQASAAVNSLQKLMVML